jgi:hypothetical protein
MPQGLNHKLSCGRLREERLLSPWHYSLRPETSRLICPVLASELTSIGRQLMLIATSRCYMLQILLTVIALLFGAPFWWDILRRLTGVRSSASISSRRPGRE